MITKEIDCPVEGCDSLLQVEFDETDKERQEITCEGCGFDLEIEYVPETDALILYELEDDGEDDDDGDADETEISIGDEEDED